MVAVIPAHFIVGGIDAIDRVGIKVFRITVINKRMLRPVTQHHYKACKKKGITQMTSVAFRCTKHMPMQKKINSHSPKVNRV